MASCCPHASPGVGPVISSYPKIRLMRFQIQSSSLKTKFMVKIRIYILEKFNCTSYCYFDKSIDLSHGSGFFPIPDHGSRIKDPRSRIPDLGSQIRNTDFIHNTRKIKKLKISTHLPMSSYWPKLTPFFTFSSLYQNLSIGTFYPKNCR